MQGRGRQEYGAWACGASWVLRGSASDARRAGGAAAEGSAGPGPASPASALVSARTAGHSRLARFFCLNQWTGAVWSRSRWFKGPRTESETVGDGWKRVCAGQARSGGSRRRLPALTWRCASVRHLTETQLKDSVDLGSSYIRVSRRRPAQNRRGMSQMLGCNFPFPRYLCLVLLSE